MKLPKPPVATEALPTPPTRWQQDHDRCIDEVDQILDREVARLREKWDSISAADVDVLKLDLPEWIATQLTDGKRFRVSMCFWGFVAASGVPHGPGYDDMLNVAAALELLHMFALIHDDVMDESTSRRGRPSAHVEAAGWHQQADALGDTETFARNIAILAGDLAHTAADELIDTLPTPMRSLWYQLCLELILGQRADLTGTAAGRRNLSHAQEVAKLKSGRYTATRPLQLGALAAGASPEVLAALSKAGDDIGQAFAYRDDVLGVWGDPTETGKPAGDDLAEGKVTVIMALGHDRLSGMELQRLNRLGTAEMAADDVASIQQALLEAGVRDEVEEWIVNHLQAADQHLAAEVLHAPGIAGIKRVAHSIAWRHR